MNIGCMYIPLEHYLSRGMNMQDINSLLDACKVASGSTSDNQLAAALGVGRSAISNYRHARALPDPVVCATIAGLSGIPLARVLGIVGEARAISREEKAVWRKLAATAMALAIAVGFGGTPTAAKASGISEVGNVYYVKNERGRLRRYAGLLKPAPASLLSLGLYLASTSPWVSLLPAPLPAAR